MKILLACEGQSEVYLLNSLIKNKILSFDEPLLLEEPLHMRQLKEISPIINSLPIDEEIIVYRIGDTLKDEFSLIDFKMRKNHIKSFKVCTKPEIEILVIINEGLYDDYKKVTRNKKPKSYIREKMPSFDPFTYFEKHNMLNAIKEYKRVKKHSKEEFYLIGNNIN